MSLSGETLCTKRIQINSELYSASPSGVCLARSYTLVMHFAKMLQLDGLLHFLLLLLYDSVTN